MSYMDFKQIFVMLLAIGIAFLMAFRPKYFVRNPSRQTKTYLYAFSTVGKAVGIVLIVGFAIMIIKAM